MNPVIETHDLCKQYGRRMVVDHLALSVPEGCVYGFLGPNGAGKSTSMKMLLGLVPPHRRQRHPSGPDHGRTKQAAPAAADRQPH